MTTNVSNRIRSQLNATSMRTLTDLLFDANARLETIIWLPAAIGEGNAVPEPLRDLIEESADQLKRCFPTLPDYVLQQREDGFGTHAFATWVGREKLGGFAVQIATPIMDHHRRDASFSWAVYSSSWVYGDTLFDAVLAGLRWVAEYRAKEQRRAIEEAPLPGPVFLDLETTGLSAADGDEVLEIALVDMAGSVLLHSLVRPIHETEWPEAMAVNGITPAMVSAAPTLEELGEQIRTILQDRQLVAYNMAFDLPFLAPVLDGALEAGINFFPYCAMRRYSAVEGSWDQKKGNYKRWKLVDAAAHIGHQWTGEAHSAVADAQACRSVWLWLEGWQ